HPGCMVQIGLNMGARHARTLGWAKSFTRKLSDSTMICEDHDVIAAGALFWSFAQHIMPYEIIMEIKDAMKGMPNLATRNVPPGEFFQLTLNDKTYYFPDAGRSPHTIYLTDAYTA
ncbi:hypothetical protein FISHEDRAFT_54302, partial [Fistulina hepatica ATCC 64428]